MRDVKLYKGDCLDKLKEISNESVDLIVTSPPYDDLRDYEHDLNIGLLCKELYRVVKRGGVVV